jgi:RNA polymerase sigma factor (sigma-70 family)
MPVFKTEYDLAKALLRGESAAHHRFYEQYSSKMLAVSCRYISDRMAAEDVMVETVMKIFSKINQFSFIGSFEGWVKRIMVNESLMHLRGKKIFEVDVEEAYNIGVEINFDGTLEEEELLKLINDLPLGYRTVFNLYAIEGYSHAEIAEMLNISEGTSKSQLSRARLILQEKIKKNSIIDLEINYLKNKKNGKTTD